MQQQKHVNKISFLVVAWVAFLLFPNFDFFFFPFAETYKLLIGGLLIVVYYLFSKNNCLHLGQRQGLYFSLIIVALILLFGVTFSKAPNYGREKALIFLAYTLIYFFSAPILYNRFQVFIKLCLVLSVIYFGLLFYNFGDPITYLKSMQFNEIRLGLSDERKEFLNPIWVSRYLGFGVIILINLKNNRKKYYSYIRGGGILLFSLYMIASASRGPVLALAISVFCVVFNFKKRKTFIRFTTLVILGVTIFYLIGLENNEYIISRFGFFNSGLGTVNIREDTYSTILKETLDSGKIFFGHGTGSAGYYLTGTDRRSYPHNLPLELLFENGIILLFLFLSMVWHAVRLTFRFRSKSKEMRFWLMITIFYIFNSLVSGDLMANHLILFGYLNLSYFTLRCTKINQLKPKGSKNIVK